jgi:hypothetical protein
MVSVLALSAIYIYCGVESNLKLRKLEFVDFTFKHLHTKNFTFKHLHTKNFTFKHLHTKNFTFKHLHTKNFTFKHLHTKNLNSISGLMVSVLALSAIYIYCGVESNLKLRKLEFVASMPIMQH